VEVVADGEVFGVWVPHGFGGMGCVTSLMEVLFSVGCAGIVDFGSVVALRANNSG